MFAFTARKKIQKISWISKNKKRFCQWGRTRDGYLPFKLGMAKIFNMAKMFLVPFLFEKLEYVP
jgi:hypothetical protein